jgi:hypothetical protein
MYPPITPVSVRYWRPMGVSFVYCGGVLMCVAVEESPFEVIETGWGEFEIQMRAILYPEASEKPLTLFHFLHLYPNGPNKDEEKKRD